MALALVRVRLRDHARAGAQADARVRPGDGRCSRSRSAAGTRSARSARCPTSYDRRARNPDAETVLAEPVFAGGRSKPFAELTADEVRARAEELRDATGLGPDREGRLGRAGLGRARPPDGATRARTPSPTSTRTPCRAGRAALGRAARRQPPLRGGPGSHVLLHYAVADRLHALQGAERSRRQSRRPDRGSAPPLRGCTRSTPSSRCRRCCFFVTRQVSVGQRAPRRRRGRVQRAARPRPGAHRRRTSGRGRAPT